MNADVQFLGFLLPGSSLVLKVLQPNLEPNSLEPDC